MKHISYLIIFLFLTMKITAQEKLSGLSDNPIIKKFLAENPEYFCKNDISKSDTLQLPFWDDFSDSHIFPKQELWNDKNVYINSTFTPLPPSIGVATFDAVDSTGSFYEDADYELPFIADKLTSKPINLYFPDNNSVYLSFYFRPEGLGDAPETADSLILEFYAPESETWNNVWFAEGDYDTDFEFVIIQIIGEEYLQNGFRFRFKNYVTLGSETYPSLAGNCDHWHIDYIYLNKDRTANDNVFRDLAFNKPLHSLLKDYEAVPWSHYKYITKNILRENINISYKNNNNNAQFIDSLNFYIADISGNSGTQKLEAGASNSPPYSQTNFEAVNTFSFPENSHDFASFEFKANIVTAAYDSVQNNTITYNQRFSDYYAYDDGTAEAGYGLYGAGTKFGSVAYKFYPEKPDDLNAVRMYFTKTLNDASSQYFWLNIWLQGDDGMPEQEPVYTLEGVRPEYENELNKFHLYEFDESVALDDTFFIGWTQTTNDMLNVGFDLNNIANQNLYFNISGQWEQSEIEGAVMIRPVFGDINTNIENPENLKTQIKIYPNPAKDILNLQIPKSENNISILIHEIHGKEILRKNNFSENKINISNLKTGIYILTIISENYNIFKEKFIVIK